jgi:hypothetical protein
MHREGEESLSPDLKGLGVQRSEPSDGRTRGLPSCPVKRVPHDVVECPGMLFGSGKSPGPVRQGSLPEGIPLG